MKKKIGIMGGTFDPPHMGHLAMAECVKSVMALDEIWFIPTGKITYKNRDGLPSPQERLAMVSLAVEGIQDFSVNSMEVESREPRYSYQTMEKLTEEYPDAEFFFIVGADSLDYMDAWREPERLLRCCVVVAVNRTGITDRRMEDKKRLLEERFGARIVLVAMPPVDVSSTMLREALKRGEDVRKFLPEPVWDYISKNGLYQES